MLCLFLPGFSFAQMKNSGNLRFHHGSTINIQGHFINTGNHTHHAVSHLALQGNGGVQTFKTVDTLRVHNLIISNSDGVEFDGIIEVEAELVFAAGIISKTNTAIANTQIIMLDGSTVPTSASSVPLAPTNSSYANIKIKKIGNDAFTFPVGDDDIYRPIKISAPSNVTDEFCVEYFRKSPTLDGYDRSLKEASINTVSDFGYYDLQRTKGTSDVVVELCFDTLEWTALNDVCDLVVAHWDGTQWENLGNGGASILNAGPSFGFVSSGDGSGACGSPQPVSSFSPFALGSTNALTPLPVELINFTAELKNRVVELNWETKSEINNDYFIVERSRDGFNWENLNQVDGAGNSVVSLIYESFDNIPFVETSYYRLKQVDFDGVFKYSNIQSVNLINGRELQMFPNPAKYIVNIVSTSDIEVSEVKLFNSLGVDLMHRNRLLFSDSKKFKIDVYDLPTGMYTLLVNGKSFSFVKE